MRTFVFALVFALVPGLAIAQFKQETTAKGPRFEGETTQRIRVGVEVSASGGNLLRVVATAPVPIDWPEQKVQIVREDVTPNVKDVSYRSITGGGGLKQLVVEIPQLLAGQEARALITFEVTRQALGPPADTSSYRIPKKLDRVMTLNVGSSPYIESRHPKIIAAAKEAVASAETDWQKAEAIFNKTRERVTFKSGELKGAARALIDQEGDTDELTSLFIAMCRAQKIPARTVFVPGNCYAEFYLDDDDGQGHWFACQPAGTSPFGVVTETRPILQKGDSFKNPENPKERLRYVTEHFSASGRGGKPQVQFHSELVAE